jgi:hypothetical protein
LPSGLILKRQEKDEGECGGQQAAPGSGGDTNQQDDQREKHDGIAGGSEWLDE